MPPIGEVLPYIRDGVKLLPTITFPNTGTIVQRLFDKSATKGSQVIKRTIFPRWALFEIADIHYIDFSRVKGKKVLEAYNRNDELVAEGIPNIREKLMKVIRRAEGNCIREGWQCYMLRG